MATNDSILRLLAFDHRGSLLRGLLGVEGEPSAEQARRVRDLKGVILDGVLRARERAAERAGIGVLVDEQFGADVARRAASEGLCLVMPVERTGQDTFQFEYGDDFGAHIEAFDPAYPKALVRYNPAADPDRNAVQRERLGQLSRWLAERGRRLMVELLIPPEPEHLEQVGGDRERYDADVRPGLVCQAVTELRDSGVAADVWKLEGLETAEDCQAVSTVCREGAPAHVGCVVLGRGADAGRVRHWLETAAGVEGFIGFAIGRSIWWDAITDVLAERAEPEAAAETIARNYLLFDEVFRSAQRVP